MQYFLLSISYIYLLEFWKQNWRMALAVSTATIGVTDSKIVVSTNGSDLDSDDSFSRDI